MRSSQQEKLRTITTGDESLHGLNSASENTIRANFSTLHNNLLKEFIVHCYRTF